MKNKNLYKIAVEGFALAACVVLICSCLSFNIGDKPSSYVWPANNFDDSEVSLDYARMHQGRTANWCGPVGAFLAYYLMYYIGPGIFVILIFIAWGLGLNIAGVKITQPILRITGLALLAIAVSCTVQLLWPYTENGFPMGNGGILGVSSAAFFKSYFAALGTSIVVGCTWIVGAVLLADTLVLAMARWIGRGILKALALVAPAWAAAKQQSISLGNIWKKLSKKQKQYETPFPYSHDPDIDLESVIGSEPAFVSVIEDEPATEQFEYKEQLLDKELEPSEASVESAEKDIKRKVSAKKQKAKGAYVQKTYEDYALPPLDLLKTPEYGFAAVQEKMVERKSEALEGLLLEFGINANVVSAEPGPAITMYELELAPGIKVSQISNLANDMARALGAGSVRVVAPLPGRHTIGIEVPNTQREIVRIKDLVQRGGTRPQRMYIPLFLGKSSSGEVLASDLASMPHLLIAGTTGSGKSVCINSIITSILLTRRPDEVKLILVDPKMVEMAAFDMLPHLMCPIVTDIKRAEQILHWAMVKMDERYELLAEAKVRNIASYNKLGHEEIIERFDPSSPEEEAKIPKKMPHIVIIIDELADLMMTAAKEIEAYIVRLAQKSRAVGIHLIVATQRPQATVVTGLIKSNMPARIGFRVASRMDSRIILDQNGAETLLGQGDMLFLKPGTSDLVRSQGAFVDDHEIRKIIQYLKEIAQPQFHPELMQLNRIDLQTEAKDDLYEDAVRIVLETKRGSVSLLQRRLSIGYARASRIIEMMAASGLLGEYKGSQAREVTMNLAEYEEAKKQATIDETAMYEDLSDEEYDEVSDDKGGPEYDYDQTDEETDKKRYIEDEDD